jgi:hypothetical protein
MCIPDITPKYIKRGIFPTECVSVAYIFEKKKKKKKPKSNKNTKYSFQTQLFISQETQLHVSGKIHSHYLMMATYFSRNM